jgi:hypothetical protein
MVSYFKTDGIFFAEFDDMVFVTDGNDIIRDDECRGLGRTKIYEEEFDVTTSTIPPIHKSKLQAYVDRWTSEQMGTGLSAKVTELKKGKSI